MAIIKLAKGDRVPFIVSAVIRDVPANNPRYGPSHKFVGRTETDTDAAVFMSPASADRQLARNGLTLDTVVGKAIVFARPGEYVDIEPYSAESAQPALSPALAAPAAKPAPASNAKQPFSVGPHVPGLDPEPPASAPAAAPATLASPAEVKLQGMFALYDRCLEHAVTATKAKLGNSGVPATHEGISAMCSTLFIQANMKGLGA